MALISINRICLLGIDVHDELQSKLYKMGLSETGVPLSFAGL